MNRVGIKISPLPLIVCLIAQGVIAAHAEGKSPLRRLYAYEVSVIETPMLSRHLSCNSAYDNTPRRRCYAVRYERRCAVELLKNNLRFRACTLCAVRDVPVGKTAGIQNANRLFDPLKRANGNLCQSKLHNLFQIFINLYHVY